MFKRIGIAILSLLLIAQSVPLAARAAEDPVVTTTPESVLATTPSPTPLEPTTTTTTVTSTPTTSTTPTTVSTTPETRTTTNTNQNAKDNRESEGEGEEEEKDDDEVVDTSNEHDLDLHKNLEGIVRQSKPYTCGPAALATLLSQLGDDTTEQDVLNFASADKELGVSLFALKQASVGLGHSIILKKWTPNQLADYLKTSEDPILIHDIKPDVGGHFSVVRDIKDGTVYLSDTEAGNITYSFSDFSNVFTGYTLIADPDTSNSTSSSNLLLFDTSTTISDEEAKTITGKYVPVAIAAANNGASTASNTFTQCMKEASLKATTQLRRTEQSQCYQTLGAALSQVSISTEATIAFQAGQSITGIDMAKDLQYTINSDTFQKLTQEKDLANQAITTAQITLQKAKDLVVVVQATLEQAKTKQQQVLQANAVLQGKKTDYQNQLANKQNTLQALNSQISSAKLSLGSITASISAASTNLGSLSKSLQAKLSNTQSQITSKQSTLRSLQQEINQRQNSINSYYSQISTLQNTITYKKSRRQSYSYEQNQLNNLQYRLQSEQTSLQRAQTTYNQTQNDLTNLQQQLSSGNNQVAQEQVALNALKQKQQIVQQDLQRKQAELPRIQNDITVLTQALNKLPQPAPVPPVDYTPYNQAVNNQNQAQTTYNSAVTRYNQAVQAIQDEKNFIDAQEKVLDTKIERDIVVRPVVALDQAVKFTSFAFDVGTAFVEASPATTKTTQAILEEINNPAFRIARSAIVQIVDDTRTCVEKAGVQECLSSCGLLDVTGPVAAACDATNGAIYLYNGEKIQAGASFFAVIPMVGTLGKGVTKGAIRLTKEASEAVRILKVTDEAVIAAKKAAQLTAREVAKSKKIFYNYAQTTINTAEMFKQESLYSLMTVDELAEALKMGKMKPDQVPLDYVVRDGIRVVENTKTVVAYERSGMDPEKWGWRPANRDSIARLDRNLANNNLPPTGIDTIRFR